MVSLSDANSKNVLGTELKCCCTQPLTGWYRDGYCKTDQNDKGLHVVCAQVTTEFLEFSKAQGNDLTQNHGPSFPGLNEGDKWCLCAGRWLEAYKAGKAPPVDLEATSVAALLICTLE